MNITIIGASAGIGLEAVKRAIDRQHFVTTLSRSKIEIEPFNAVNSIQGDALNKDELRQSIKSADAVLVTLGTGKNMKATTLFSDFAKAIVEVQSETNTQIPFIFVTGFGTGESQKYVSSWFVKLFLRYMLKDVYEDKAKMESIVSAAAMNWIFVRPGRLLDGAVTEKYRTESTLFKGINIGGINRSDVADFMVKQAENPTEMKQFVGISAK